MALHHTWPIGLLEFQGFRCFSELGNADGNLLTIKICNFAIVCLSIGGAILHMGKYILKIKYLLFITFDLATFKML